MTLIYLLVQLVFDNICGWVGYITAKTVTLGRIELEWGSSSESVIAECIGGGVLLALAVLVSLLIGYG